MSVPHTNIEINQFSCVYLIKSLNLLENVGKITYLIKKLLLDESCIDLHYLSNNTRTVINVNVNKLLMLKLLIFSIKNNEKTGRSSQHRRIYHKN